MEPDANKQNHQKNNTLALVLGTVIGIVALYLSFKGISLKDLWEVLKQANGPLTLLSLLVVLANVAIFSFRWWITLLDTWKTENYFVLMNGVYLGQMLNIVFPARLGELARVFYVGENLKISKSRLLGTLVVEKAIDMATFGGAILILLVGATLPEWVLQPGRVLIWASLAAMITVLLLTFWGVEIVDFFEPRFKFLPKTWQERTFKTLRLGLSGLESLRSWKRQLGTWTLSILIIGLSALTNHLLLLALNIDSPLITALFVLVVTQVGISPPSTPGKVGVFNYLVILALSAFGIEKEIALAYSLILYFVALFPKIIYGAVVLVRSPINLKSIQLSRSNDPS